MSDDTMAPTTPPQQDAPANGPLRDRRTVLRCAAIAALAGASAPILAACGGGDNAGSGSGTAPSPPPPPPDRRPRAPPPPPPPAPPPPPPPPGPAPGAGGGTVLGPVSDV